MSQKCYERKEPCSGKYYIHRTANGGKYARAWCERCLTQPPSTTMNGQESLSYFFQHEIDRMEEFASVVTPEFLGHKPCAKCGAVGLTERHHWAPRHLFVDADDWPTSDLCSPCHKRWHEVVTPKMAHQTGAWAAQFSSAPTKPTPA